MSVRVRFAPSPTGYLHVGGARSALFNYLFARHHHGVFILRIEDTDRSRYKEDACKEIYESLRWLGLPWNEGPEAGGDFGPYIQSERTELYREHAQRLLSSGHAYRCFCAADRLTAIRAQQEISRQPVGYDRHCREIPLSEQERLLSEGNPHVIRLKVPPGRSVAFEDAVRGRIEYSSDVLDDLVLLKSDGFPTYHLANVVDDHLMQISHVLRGDEWIASTPRHVLLYEAFGWSLPVFAHLPVILSPDGGKLSKRKGAASVMDYQRAGYLPEALFNFLALLGWSPGDDREKMSVEDLTTAFSLDHVSPKAAVFDEKKLEWLNGQYMAGKSSQSLAVEVRKEWADRGWIDSQTPDSYILSVIDVMKVRSRTLRELVENCGYFFRDPDEYEKDAARKHLKPESAPLIDELAGIIDSAQPFSASIVEERYREYAGSRGLSTGKLIHPTRVAISGVSYGPGLFELIDILGKERVVRRMRRASGWVRNNTSRSGE